MTTRCTLRRQSQLTDPDLAAVLALADAAAEHDGVFPLSEHVLLHLRYGDPDGIHLLASDPNTGTLLGYGHLDVSEPAEGPSAELAVAPGARSRRVGTALLGELLRVADGFPGRLRLWAHGADTPAERLAAAHGFHRVRNLLQLRRSLHAPLDPVELPDGVTLRTFDPDRDRPAWLSLNRRAFAALPDQGGWSPEELDRRMTEPWFDPAGFLLAQEPTGRLVGFHWTKVHGRLDGDPHGHDPLGEVYVLGVDPAFRGRGLGRALTLAGLHHLRARGLPVATLYVDQSNTAAIALYTSLGFAAWDRDTLFSR